MIKCFFIIVTIVVLPGAFEANPRSLQKRETAPITCIVVPGASSLELQGAFNGYDAGKANPNSQHGDPGIRGRIFLYVCDNDGTQGYYDFAADIRPNLNCVTDFSSKSIRSYSGYLSERGSSNSFEVGASVEASANFGFFSATASASFATGTDSTERSMQKFFGETNGEVIQATAKCHTNVVAISPFVRPKFTRSFIAGMRALAVAIGKSPAEQKQAFAAFVQAFGTHFMSETEFGARLIYERRFTSQSSDSSQSNSRSSCTKTSASACVGGGGFGVSAKACANVATGACADSRDDQSYGSANNFETTRTLSFGSRPKTLNDWAGSDFKPIPIDRKLQLLSKLFKPEWLTVSESYGIANNSIDGNGIKVLFESHLGSYCELVWGKTVAECEAELKGCGIAGSCPTGQVCINDNSESNGYRCRNQWYTIFRHDSTSGHYFPSQSSVTNGIHETYLFSQLNQLKDFYTNDGKFHFRLEFPELNGGVNNFNEWKQTSNPTTEAIITGFEAININFQSDSIGRDFHGLGLNPSGSSYCAIDDSPDSSNWWSCIGAYSAYPYGGNSGHPGPAEKPVMKTNLYIATSTDTGGFCIPEYGIDYAGNDMTNHNGLTSWELCAQRCQEAVQCKYWTWRKEYNNRGTGSLSCWLKTSNAGRREDRGVVAISGAKGCTKSSFC